VKRLLVIVFVLCATIALCAQPPQKVWKYWVWPSFPNTAGSPGDTPPELTAIAKLPPPAVVLIYRTVGVVRVPKFEMAWIYNYRGFASEAEAVKFLGDEDISDERFVGLFKVGAKLAVSMTEETVATPKKIRKWKKP
jgi:hypothetical protein